MGVIFVITAVQSAAILGALGGAAPLVGLDGVGLAWLAALTAIAVVLLAGDFRTVWLPYVRPASIRPPVRGWVRRHRAFGRGRSARRGAARLHDDHGRVGTRRRGGGRRSVPRRAGDDVYTVTLRDRADGGEALLKIASTAVGASSLRRSRAALVALRTRSRPRAGTGWFPGRSRPSRFGDWILETRVAGDDARRVARAHRSCSGRSSTT